jgi:hypothetical protein
MKRNKGEGFCLLGNDAALVNFCSNLLTLEDKGTKFFKMSGATCPAMQDHVPKDWTHHLHHCENLDTYKKKV